MAARQAPPPSYVRHAESFTMAHQPTRRIARTVLHDNPRLALLEDRIVTHTGRERIHWKVDYKRHGVGVVPVMGDGRVLLGLHWRYCLEAWSWEIAAGSVDPGEDVAATARRELVEETGHDGRIEYCLKYHPAPGLGNETFHVHIATDLRPVDGEFDSEEIYELKPFAWNEIEAMLADGRIVDGFTVTSLYLAKARGMLQ